MRAKPRPEPSGGWLQTKAPLTEKQKKANIARVKAERAAEARARRGGGSGGGGRGGGRGAGAARGRGAAAAPAAKRKRKRASDAYADSDELSDDFIARSSDDDEEESAEESSSGRRRARKAAAAKGGRRPPPAARGGGRGGRAVRDVDDIDEEEEFVSGAEDGEEEEDENHELQLTDASDDDVDAQRDGAGADVEAEAAPPPPPPQRAAAAAAAAAPAAAAPSANGQPPRRRLRKNVLASSSGSDGDGSGGGGGSDSDGLGKTPVRGGGEEAKARARVRTAAQAFGSSPETPSVGGTPTTAPASSAPTYNLADSDASDGGTARSAAAAASAAPASAEHALVVSDTSPAMIKRPGKANGSNGGGGGGRSGSGGGGGGNGASAAAPLELASDEGEAEGSGVDTDEGGSSDDEAAARARAMRVLDQCRGLSEKLTAVVAAWAPGARADQSAGSLMLSKVSSSAAVMVVVVVVVVVWAPGARADQSAGSLTLSKVTADHARDAEMFTDADVTAAPRADADYSLDADVNADRARDAEMFTDADVAAACAPGLQLSPYQLAGVNWMGVLRRVGVNGVLADEMGLGKTVQTIAFLGLMSGAGTGPHLIVVPSSVLANWQSELERFCPALEVAIYHGSQAERADMRNGDLGRAAKGLGSWAPHVVLTTYSLWEREAATDDSWAPHVVLTTYSLWKREAATDDRKFLKRFRYEYMVLDEGHSIKNSSGSRFRKLSEVHCKHRLLLSGTPVQNNLKELLALLRSLMPEAFSCGRAPGVLMFRMCCLLALLMFLMPKVFRADAVLNLLEMLEEGMSNGGSAHRGRGGLALPRVADVRGMLSPFVLRRLKSAVLEQLVPKTTDVDVLPLGDMQKQLYDGILKAHLKRKGGGVKGDAAEDTNAVVAAIVGSTTEAKNVFTELRKAANHPLLLLHHYKDDATISRIVEVAYGAAYFGDAATPQMVRKELETFSDYDMHQLCSHFPALEDLTLQQDALFSSAKMVRLRGLLPELQAQGHRVLLFSQWTRILDLMEVFLSEVLGMRYTRLDGSTPVQQRQALIQGFAADPGIAVFLLSTRAGGLGINLTSADTVILHDLDFNPENDKQAEDRIGQTKPVRVIKLVAQGTVDEDIYRLGARKASVSAAVLDEVAPGKKGAQGDADGGTIAGILNRAIRGAAAVLDEVARGKKGAQGDADGGTIAGILSRAIRGYLKRPAEGLGEHGESTHNAQDRFIGWLDVPLDRFIGWLDVPLTEKGEGEARRAGRALAGSNFKFDGVVTSMLKRAIKTSWLVMDELDQAWIPDKRTWLMNERFFGDLVGRNRLESDAIYGTDSVTVWRSEYRVPPPPMPHSNPLHPATDRRYAQPGVAVPSTECMADVEARTSRAWEENFKGRVLAGERLLVCAHAVCLKTLLRYLDDIPEQDIYLDDIPEQDIYLDDIPEQDVVRLAFPRATPIVYFFDEHMQPLRQQGTSATGAHPWSGVFVPLEGGEAAREQVLDAGVNAM
ncbi:SNF2 family N-terminal domain-containing protein [Tribonema minus]|uniref:phosphoglycerate mutase (2,3-diphosphoglycerate-dependent) n=1 Tax=Tribonema minus TaxID=303371 RepID=A0A835Z3Y7_9STRA|nr:SNF2 family N-terminal domain-containing protein [Tribonema minus]